jgi:hypothetical protein
MRSQVQAGDAREGGQRHGAEGELADGEPRPRRRWDTRTRQSRGFPAMRALTRSAGQTWERGRPGDEPREYGTDHEVHGEAERELVDIREGPDSGKAGDEGPSEQREGRERERRMGGADGDRDGDIGSGAPSRIVPAPTQPPEGRPEECERGHRGGDGGRGNGPLVKGACLEHAQGGDVGPKVQGAVAHEQAQHRKVDGEHQRREPAETLRPRVDPGAGPPAARGHWRDLRSERRRAW